MKRILLLVLMLMVFITTCAFASGGSVYEDRFHNTFRITLPNDWQSNQVDGAIFAATAPNHSTLKIYIDVANKEDPFSSKEEEEEFATAIVEETNTVKDNRHIMIDKRDAIRIISVDDKKSTYTIQYTFYKKGVIFVVIGEGELGQLDEDQSTFDQIMSTFKLLY